MKSIKDFARRLWKFLWEEESVASWIANIVLAYVLIKFLLYPGLGWALGTPYPIVAVVSGSMEHDAHFEEWWNSPAVCFGSLCTQGDWYREQGISREEFWGYPYREGFDTGDIMILYGTSPKDIKRGDILVFQHLRPEPIIHRVVNIAENNNEIVFQTKGDHNQDSSTFDMGIHESMVVGRAVFRIPYLGYVKIGALRGVCTFKEFDFCL